MPKVRPIDANAFAEQYGNYYAEEGPEEGFIGTVGELIAQQPTIEVEPVRHGRWIVRGQEIYCSECNEESLYNPFGASKFSRFCPNCGVEMRVEDADND